ncbi:MAG: septum formation protein Maf [Planctomycetes bacterium]|nr:septum formation protein Maf [Planctomycetota bacterium]
MMHLKLASRSPRRRELLEEAGYTFDLVDVDVDETIEEVLDPVECARRLAKRKAVAGAQCVEAGWVLGADTLVVLGTKILGKPVDRSDAKAMLHDLSGSRHEVITGVCLVEARTGETFVDAEVTKIVMRPMSESEIGAYVATGESDDKAGAYAIQENGDRFVESMEGSYTNVVGLPMELLGRMVEEVTP